MTMNRLIGITLMVLTMAGCASAPRADTRPAPDLSRYRAAVIGAVHIEPTAGEALSAAERQALEREFYEALVPLLSAEATSENDAGVFGSISRSTSWTARRQRSTPFRRC
jgi:hypothetical protein